MTKSFIESFGANQMVLAENLIREEFISGILNETCQRTKDEVEMLSNMTQTMKEFFSNKRQSDVCKSIYTKLF